MVALIRRLARGARLGASAAVPPADLYGERVIEVAERYLDVRERRRNRGPGVDLIVEAAGGRLGDHWCALFASFCHETAAEELGGFTTLPLAFDRGAVKLFVASLERHTVLCFRASDVLGGGRDIMPGDIAVNIRGAADEEDAAVRAARVWRRGLPADHRWTAGHARLCVRCEGTIVETIEANVTGPEGDGVYRRELSLTDPALVGFLRPRLLLE